MKLAILLVLCCVAFAHSLRIFNQNNDNSLACCGSRTFDTTTQICCINSVYSIPDSNSNSQAVCCGTSLLKQDQICCEETPGTPSTSDKAISSDRQCCGTQAYDPNASLCCLGKIVTNSNGNLQCCGTKGHNPSTDLCCPDPNLPSASVVTNGVTNGQECCGTGGYNPSSQLCCAGKSVSNTNGNLICCDADLYTTAFDPSTQTCCGGVANNGANRECCGTKAYDSATSLCCNEIVLSNPNSNLQCCGSNTFNPETQTCCFEQSETLKRDGKDCDGCKHYVAVTTTQYKITNIPTADSECCGLQAYDPSKSQCCSGKINSLVINNVDRACCGTTTYDPNNDLCCPEETASNAVVQIGGKNRPNVECCGTSTYNTETQTCQCGRQVSKAADINELGGLGACCGTTQYNNISATCCSSDFGNFLYPLQPAAGFKCCPQDGKSLYNPGYQVCCDRKTSCTSVSTPAKLALRDVEEVSIDFRALKGNFHPRDTHDFEALLEKHARATRDVEEVEELEEVEDLEASKKDKKKKDKKKDKKKKDKKKDKKKNKKSKKADSRSRTSGNIPNNDDEKFPLVQCGDSCCNGQGYFQAFQRCCGNVYDGWNVIDVSNTDAASSPLACCGNNIYNTQFEGCCSEVKSIDSCNNVKANFGIYKLEGELCCTDA